ncbi:MAG TPA: hypothetical protein VF721_03225 [Pyrinomonadaceae bacterium]|jgi:hypothetical protein
MSLRISENYYYYGYEVLTEDAPSGTENQTAEAEQIQTQTIAQRNNPKLPPIPSSVDFTALGIDTELKLARAAYMAAAAKAGIADTSAQRRFADRMIAANSPELKLTKGNVPLDDAIVKGRLMNQGVRFTLSAGDREALRLFRQQYVAENGKIRSNQKPTVDLRQAQTAEGVTLPPTQNVQTKFRVLLNNNGKPITDTRVLAQYAQDQYQGGNLWGENYIQIAELSAGQGVKPKITNITRLGDKIAVDFELTPLNRAVIHENYKVVQAEVNRAEAIYRDIRDNNELASFLRGVFNGAVKSVKGTIDLVLDLPGTLKALWQVVAHPIDTFNALKNELSETWEQFKNASPSKKAEMIGELVGSAVVEILIGKGIGKAGSILAKTKTGAKLLEEAGNLKKAGLVKIAEAFSDEAAEIAARRFRQKLQTQLYSGIPADALADLAVVAGNRIGKGAVRFADFSRLMVQEFGDRVKPYLEKLYREAMEKLGRKVDDAEISITDLNKVTTRQPITAANLASVVIPGVKGGEFASWFNSLSRPEMNLLWTNKALRETVENRLRHPGGFHEWLPVSRAPKFREWGVTAEQIWDLRSQTKDLRFINPDGWHGGKGSPQAHRELFDMVDRANSFAEFKTLIQQWAARRLPNGVNDLPPGLR